MVIDIPTLVINESVSRMVNEAIEDVDPMLGTEYNTFWQDEQTLKQVRRMAAVGIVIGRLAESAPWN